MTALLFRIQERVRPSLVRLPDVRMERTSIPHAVVRKVLEVVHRPNAVEWSEGHRRAIFESPDDEGAGKGLVRRQPGRNFFHAGVEVDNILLQLSEDEKAPEAVILGRERIVDQDQTERSGRIPGVDSRGFLGIEVGLQEEWLAARVDIAEVFDWVASRVPQDRAALDRQDF